MYIICIYICVCVCVCAKYHNHMNDYCSCNMECDRQNAECFVIMNCFLHFFPFWTQKKRILKK